VLVALVLAVWVVFILFTFKSFTFHFSALFYEICGLLASLPDIPLS